MLWDLQRALTLRAADLHQQVGYCPYGVWPVRGYPRDVISRGQVIVRDAQFVGERGWGRFLARNGAV